MEALNRSRPLGRARRTFADRADIDEFVEKLEAFERGDLTPDKARNRMKFLIKELGRERWRAELDRSLAEVRSEGEIPLPFDPESPPVVGSSYSESSVPSLRVRVSIHRTRSH